MGIKQFWAWLSNLASRLLPRRHEEKLVQRVDLDQKLGREIQKRQARGKPIDTRQGGPNMPKSQPCHRCHRRSKRVEKTAGGANYRCPKHGKFFVRAPGL